MRPALDPEAFQPNQQAWDALFKDYLRALVARPFPLAEYANFAALPAANQYDRCLAVTTDNKLWFSNGTTWKEVPLAP